MDVDAALQSQIRNIETTYGKSLDHWFAVIAPRMRLKPEAVGAGTCPRYAASRYSPARVNAMGAGDVVSAMDATVPDGL